MQKNNFKSSFWDSIHMHMIQKSFKKHDAS